MTFILTIGDNFERITVNDKVIQLPTLMIANALLSSTDYKDFHRLFYDVEEFYFESLQRTPTPYDNFEFYNCEDFGINIDVERESLKWALKLFLGYSKASTPRERYAACYDSNALSLYIGKQLNDSILKDIQNIYTIINKRLHKVGQIPWIYERKFIKQYTSNSLAALAWAEIIYCIENDQYARQCLSCSRWFTIKSGSTTRKVAGQSTACGYLTGKQVFCSKECRTKHNKEYKRLYDRINQQINRIESSITKKQLELLRSDLIKDKKNSKLEIDLTSYSNKYNEIISKLKENE